MSARKMKDSGIEWIGEIPEEWEVRKLKYATICNGETLSESTKSDYTFDYIDIGSVLYEGGITNTLEVTFETAPSRARRVVHENDVIISTVRTYLKAIAYIDKKYESAICSTGFAVFSPKKGYDGRFLYYSLSANWFVSSVEIISTGISYPAVSSIAMGDLKSIFPPFSEQKAIAGYLDKKCAAIDQIVVSKQKQNEQLAEYRQSLITEAVTKGLEPLAPMQDSGIEWIGEIPEKWEIKKVKYLFSVVNGATPKSSVPEYWDGDIMWITPADMSFEMFEIKDSRQKITAAGLASCGTTLVPKGSIVISTRAPIGQICIAGKELCTNQGCKTLVCFEELCNEYFYYYLKVQANVLNMLGRGTTFLELSSRDLEDFLLLLPPLAEQKEIAAYLDKKCGDIDALREHNKNIIESLQEYKQSLIYEAVTGKIEL